MIEKKRYDAKLLWNLFLALIFSSFLIVMIPFERFDKSIYVMSLVLLLTGFLMVVVSVYRKYRGLVV